MELEKPSARTLQKVLDINAEIRNTCIPRIQRATITIIGIQNDKIVHDRTGVLFRIGNHHFILTAAHDLRGIANLKIDLYISLNQAGIPPVPLLGTRFVSTEVEHRDLAVIELPPYLVTEIEKHKDFIYQDQISKLANPEHALLVFCGYPLEWANRRVTETSLVSTGLVYMSRVDDLDPTTVLNYDPTIHFLLNFSPIAQHGQTGKDMTLPDPKGISGCGIWYVGEVGVDGVRVRTADSLKLVGIQLGVYGGEDRVKATRIEFVTQLIAHNYPDTRAAMSLVIPAPPSGRIY